MNDREDMQEQVSTDDLAEMLSSADPAEAPGIAEALANRLAKELRETEAGTPNEPGNGS